MMFHAKTPRRKELLLFFLVLLIGCTRAPHPAPEWTRPPLLDVVYPRVERPDSAVVLPRLDSTFAFGSVKPAGTRLWVNGIPVQVYPNGAFLCFVPLDTFAWRFNFRAISPRGDSTVKYLPFRWFPESRAENVAAVHPMNQRLPARITISQDYATARSAPGQAYTLFPPRGSVALADSFVSGCFRMRLAAGRHAWVEEKFVTLSTDSRDIPPVSLSKIAVHAGDPWTTVEIPLSQPVFFNLEEKGESQALVVELYGVTSRLNRVDYDPADSLVREIRWQQVGDETLRLQVNLSAARLWGYSAVWQVDSIRGIYTLALQIRRPPQIKERPLQGRIIVLDPGHGGVQPGSVGPTRLAEKEPNLKLALKLKEMLEAKGARVLLTRSADSTVELYDRVSFAVKAQAEVLLSLHNNALSDGENPFVKHGSGAYYYQPMSLDLARTLHQFLIQGTGLRDNGLYYQNLAMCRPTEMPAVLVESAFMMYPEEELLLRSDRFLDRTARSLAAGLEDYFRQCKKERLP
jgi:N-acetylmuramoyl-L-alanine amidase